MFYILLISNQQIETITSTENEPATQCNIRHIAFIDINSKFVAVNWQTMLSGVFFSLFSNFQQFIWKRRKSQIFDFQPKSLLTLQLQFKRIITFQVCIWSYSTAHNLYIINVKKNVHFRKCSFLYYSKLENQCSSYEIK